MTKFFEPINVSATHIYHSALELSPISSIVRKFYYDRCHGVTRFPRVVIGTPDSWDTTVSVSSELGYGLCTWSPCSQFIAAQTRKTVEIRNPLTFELLTVLQSAKYIRPTSPLTYSPDGRSLACGFFGGIVIWDIQTGGVANKIRHDGLINSLAWSLDGSTVAITLRHGHFTTGLETYNCFSGVQLFKKQFEPEVYTCLWSHNQSFQLMEAVPHGDRYALRSLTCTISEIGPTLTEIEAFSLTPENPLPYPLTTGEIKIGKYTRVKTRFPNPILSHITFSPSTYHIAILSCHLFVYDIRTSHRLLEDCGSSTPLHCQFSPDGSHFASFRKDGLFVFRCTSGRYTLLWKSSFGPRSTSKSCLQFSPTLSSILSQHDGILQVRRLSNLPIASENRRQYTAISRSGRRIATAHRVTPLSQSSTSILRPLPGSSTQVLKYGVWSSSAMF